MLHLAIYFIIFFHEKYTIGTDINATVLSILIGITAYIIAFYIFHFKFQKCQYLHMPALKSLL